MRSQARPAPPTGPATDTRRSHPPRQAGTQNDEDLESRAGLAEFLRRFALGLTAALVTARAFWPSEPDLKSGAGAGLLWALVLLVTVGLALAASFVDGRFRFRWSWADGAFYALVLLVAASAAHAVDRRPALNLAWEWVALACAYMLLRNLPRSDRESSALAGALIATAFAVSAYGLYQGAVELPQMQAEFRRNPRPMLQKLNIQPGSHGELIFRNRLLYSSEIWSTFALPNSLAGFLVGPLVVLLGIGIQNLLRRDLPGSRWVALGMAAPVGLGILVCLLLTKSVSALVSLVAGVGVLAWQARRRGAPLRVLLLSGLAGLVVVVGLVTAALATGRLDRHVLAQARRSMRYRWEYWQGAWGVITGGARDLRDIVSSPFLWSGVGPGSFGGPYLLHKLPAASEEILDPHNLFLEIWATAGLWALLALAAAVGLVLCSLLPVGGADHRPERDPSSTPSRRMKRNELRAPVPLEAASAVRDDDGDRRSRSLLAAAGSGWVLAVLVGQLDPFQGDLFYRWLILGASWALAASLLAPLLRRVSVPATALGAGVLGLVIALLASGGIGIPTVALCLWSMSALGLNLRADRPCSRLYEYSSRLPAFGLAVVWSAVMGTFLGLTVPFWRAEHELAEAEAARARRPPDYDRAEASYIAAIAADRYQSRPWLGLTNLYWTLWQERGAKVDDPNWRKIPFLLHDAASPPRNALAWSLHSDRADALERLVQTVGQKLEPDELIRLRSKIVEATRTASRLHPTSAVLHARLAAASAEISMYQDAVTEATEALRLDQLTPHPDRKLPDLLRARLTAQMARWRQNAAAAAPKIAPP
jgi:hypothetical protein